MLGGARGFGFTGFRVQGDLVTQTPTGSKTWKPPKTDPTTTFKNLADHREVPFLDPLGGLGSREVGA